jgi:PAS domain S-box-containing protein
MNTNKIRLLLIEDDMVDQLAFKRLIKKENLSYDYEIASSVADAKGRLSSENYNVIITDYWLGDGTAFDICELDVEAPVIIITGSGDEEVAAKAMRAGAYDYLIKEPERNYLKVLPITIEKALNRWRVEEQVRMLSHAMMSINDCVYITDTNENIVFINKAFSRTYGYKTREILNQKSTLLWQDPSEMELASNIKILQEGCEIKITHRRKNGQEFPVSLTRSVIKDEKDMEIAIVSVARDITESKRAEEEREKLIHELQDALAKVRTLSGLLPICSSCKKIRDDKGYWNQIEGYIQEHSDAEFSHSLCPECATRLFPDLFEEEKSVTEVS